MCLSYPPVCFFLSVSSCLCIIVLILLSVYSCLYSPVCVLLFLLSVSQIVKFTACIGPLLATRRPLHCSPPDNSGLSLVETRPRGWPLTPVRLLRWGEARQRPGLACRLMTDTRRVAGIVEVFLLSWKTFHSNSLFFVRYLGYQYMKLSFLFCLQM